MLQVVEVRRDPHVGLEEVVRRSSYGTQPWLKKTASSSSSSSVASASARRIISISGTLSFGCLRPMNTSLMSSRRSLSCLTARIRVSGSNQFQIPPPHSRTLSLVAQAEPLPEPRTR